MAHTIMLWILFLVYPNILYINTQLSSKTKTKNHITYNHIFFFPLMFKIFFITCHRISVR
jgi:hypothetical protein